MWITLIKVHPIWLKIAVWFRLMPGMAHTKAQTHQAKDRRARAHAKRGFCPDPNLVENTIPIVHVQCNRINNVDAWLGADCQYN